MNIEFHDDFSRVKAEELKQVYHSVGWKKHSEEVIEKIFTGSQVAIFAEIGGQTVGFGRALTDGVFNAAIYDIIVRPDFQRQRIAEGSSPSSLTGCQKSPEST